MNQPEISIIIVNWNGKKWLKRCLGSLREQTFKNFETIVVDNKSSDDSIAFIRTHYPEVRLIENDRNAGFAGGNNVGIRHAKGQNILLLNNDVWLEEGFLESLFSFYKSSGCDVVAPVEADYDTKTPVEKTVTIDFMGHPVYLERGKGYKDFYLNGTCLLFSKDLYLKSGGLDDNFFMYFEETDWFWRLQLLGKTFCRAKGLYVYHAGAGSTGRGIRTNQFLWRNQNNLQMLLKNYAWYNLLWVLPLYFLQNVLEIIFFMLTLKPAIAFTYLRGWSFNIRHLKKILQQRKKVQSERLVRDAQILRNFYKGPAKLIHLINHATTR